MCKKPGIQCKTSLSPLKNRLGPRSKNSNLIFAIIQAPYPCVLLVPREDKVHFAPGASILPQTSVHRNLVMLFVLRIVIHQRRHFPLNNVILLYTYAYSHNIFKDALLKIKAKLSMSIRSCSSSHFSVVTSFVVNVTSVGRNNYIISIKPIV